MSNSDEYEPTSNYGIDDGWCYEAIGKTKYRLENVSTMHGLQGKSYPMKPVKGLCCWNDSYPIETRPFPLIVRTSKKDGVDGMRIGVEGYFCSPNCALRFREERRLKIDPLMIIWLAKTWWHSSGKRSYELSPAPPKEVLINYGGTMSIEQYRSSFHKPDENIDKYPHRLVIQTEQMVKSIRLKETPETNKISDNNGYVLDRKTPLPKKHPFALFGKS